MEAIKLYYARLANMGDLLNEIIVERVMGFKVERCSVLTGEMSAIGSHLGMYTYHGNLLMRAQQLINGRKFPHVDVWGTGFINYDDCKGRFFKQDMVFHAVRGELSRRAVERMTGRSLDIPTGDAGILASHIFNEWQEKRYDVGIIPHICDVNDPAVAALAQNYDNSVIINLRDEPIEVLRQIDRCKVILSSSLHGLIVADSFHIPNKHIVFSDRPKGDGFKFDDYYSGFGVFHMPWDLREKRPPELSQVKDEYMISVKAAEEKKTAMLKSFPMPEGWSDGK